MSTLRKQIQRLRWWFIRQHVCSKRLCLRAASGSIKIDHRKRYWCAEHFRDEIERLERQTI